MTAKTLNKVTRASAQRMVKKTERAFGAADVEAILEGFTDDIVIEFADLPEMRGKAAAEKFLRARFSRQKSYRLSKHLRMVEGDLIGNFWEGDWEDALTGRKMRGRGTEFWTVRDGKVAVWEATFNVWPDGGPPVIPII
jgi:nuclear transport factor 2 (NTF2) superfamily protein